MQSDISVSDFSITGTLKYVTEYTGFSSDTSEQSGNFLALTLTPDPVDTDVSFRVLNGTHEEYKAVDPADWTIVARISDISTQKIEVKCVKDSKTKLFTYSLEELTVLSES